MKTCFSLVTALLALSGLAHAASLKQGEFTRVINDVRMLPPQQQPVPARVGDRVTGQTAVSTGVASRAELQFSDKTLTRIGANSVFKLDQADRTVSLEKGVILLQVPKQIGGAKVRTAAVTAAVTGTTIMVERTADGYIKIIVLEGEVDVYLNDKPGEMRTLVAGDILVFKEDTNVIPLPAKVDLELLKKTSKLMDPNEFGPLGNQKHLAGALTEQDKLKNNGELLKTAFEIMGRGTQVTLTSEARQEIFKNIILRDRPAGNGGNGNGGNPGGNNGIAGNGPPGNGGNDTTGNGRNNNNNNNGSGSPPPVPTRPAAIINPGTSVFGAGSSIVTNPQATAYNSIAGGIVTMQGSIYHPGTDGPFNTFMYGDPQQTFIEMDNFLANQGDWFVFKGDELFLSGQIDVNSAPGPRNVLLGGVMDVYLSGNLSESPYSSVPAGTSWTIPSSVDALAITSQRGSIVQSYSFGLYGTGTQQLTFYAYGPTSDVSIFGPGVGSEFGGDTGVSLPGGSFKVHAGQDILFDGALVDAPEVKLNARRNVTVRNSARVAAATLLQIEALQNIHITSSSQLVALGEVNVLSVMLKAVNGNVEIADSSINAADLEMISGAGSISLTNSTILADVIKARTMGPGGELLVSNSILGRDTPSASSLIKLYGEGASGVRFVGDSTLNAVNVDIAGRTVTIENGSKVRLSHPAGTRVFSDTANFNNGGIHGDFTDKGGAPVSVTKDIFDHRPAY